MKAEQKKIFQEITGGKVQMLRDEEIDPKKVKYLVCLTTPTLNGTNRKATCCECGCALYHSDVYPGVSTICAKCVQKLTKQTKIKFFGNETSVRKALLKQMSN